MTFSRGDVVWLRVDYVEGGVGKPHPAIVLSSDEFNDSHHWGIIVRGSHDIPRDPAPEESVIKRTPENGLDADTVFLPIIQSAKWSRVIKKVGVVPPYQLRQVVERLRRIIDP